MVWHLIETAPKDQPILFGRKQPWGTGSSNCTIGCWDEHRQEWLTSEGFVIATNVYCWWQPLPSPPPRLSHERALQNFWVIFRKEMMLMEASVKMLHPHSIHKNDLEANLVVIKSAWNEMLPSFDMVSMSLDEKV